MRSEPARLGKIERNVGEIKIFQINTRKWASPTRSDGVFFSGHVP